MEDNQDEDMKRAIDESLKMAAASAAPQKLPPTTRESGVGGNISAEDQEISRVIEASLLESKKAASGSAPYSALFFVDPANPYERCRDGVWPVGLKNVGNTCWFNVVVQALYHLPEFRNRVLRDHDDEEVDKSRTTPSTSQVPREEAFLHELRCLFGFLTGSRRKYIDPSSVVDVLRRQDNSLMKNGSVDNQQDVSEFTHIMLQWLQDAFNLKEKNKPPPHPPNPVEDLFYGEWTQGADGTQTQQFSQYPLHVAGYDNLHDALEASLLVVASSGGEAEEQREAQMHWFRKLPPVLLFELSRFQFDTEKKSARKLHHRFSFPKLLFMDRYVEDNKAIVVEKRKRVNKLRRKKKELVDTLSRYESYGNSADEDSSKIGLLKILQYTQRFVTSKPSTGPVVATAAPALPPSIVNNEVSGDFEMVCCVPTEVHAVASPASRRQHENLANNNPIIQQLPPPVPPFDAHPTSSLTSYGSSNVVELVPPAPLDPQGNRVVVESTGGAGSVMMMDATEYPDDVTLTTGERPFPCDPLPCDPGHAALTSDPSHASARLTSDPGLTNVTASDPPTPMQAPPSLQHCCIEIEPVSTPDATAKNAVSNRTGEEDSFSPSRQDFVPHPRSISAEEEALISKCLKRWQSEVENDLNELRSQIATVCGSMESMYAEAALSHRQYDLHAVLVHEGQATTGHYWSFVRQPAGGGWRKFNDIQVSGVDWQELEKDSFGGAGSASAYCLIYVDSSRVNRPENGEDPSSTTLDTLLATLPPDLLERVSADNAAFAAELTRWDELQSNERMDVDASPATSSTSRKPTQSGGGNRSLPLRKRILTEQADSSTDSNANPAAAAQPEDDKLTENKIQLHHKLGLQYVLFAAGHVKNYIQAGRSQEALQEAVLCLSQKVSKALADWGQVRPQGPDPRARLLPLYAKLMCPDRLMSDAVWERLLVDLLTAGLASDSASVKCLAEWARVEAENAPTREEDETLYTKYHECFHRFQKTTLLFMNALTLFEQPGRPPSPTKRQLLEQLRQALQCIALCQELNDTEPLSSLNEGCRLDPRLVSALRRRIVLALSATLLCKLDGSDATHTHRTRSSQAEVTTAQNYATQYLLPALAGMAKSWLDADRTTVEDVCSRWLDLLSRLDSMPGPWMNDFLSKLLELGDQKAGVPHPTLDLTVKETLPSLYNQALDTAQQSGLMDEALLGLGG